MTMDSRLHKLPRPEPVPSLAAYEAEYATRLSRFPECAKNFETYTSSMRREVHPKYLPIKLDIENVSRCNFRCVMCQLSEWSGGQRAGDLSLDHFKSIIDSNPGLLEIKLQGMGEPSMGRQSYLDMIAYARERNIWVRTVTNGSLLHQSNMAEALVDSDVNEIQVSIDGATKDTYEAIRVGGHFSRVKQNVKRLNDYAAASGRARTKMWVVVQSLNVGELEELVDLAAELNFPSMVFSLDVIDWGNPTWTVRNNDISERSSFNYERGLALVERGRNLGLKVAFWTITEKFTTESPDRLCPWPFERSYVASDLRVVPCCMIADPDTFEIEGMEGNPERFPHVWSSHEYETFRLAHLEGRIPGPCKGCYEHD